MDECKPLEQVIVDPSTGAATGVRLKGGATVAAPVVVSACGFKTTFERVIPGRAARSLFSST